MRKSIGLSLVVVITSMASAVRADPGQDSGRTWVAGPRVSFLLPTPALGLEARTGSLGGSFDYGLLPDIGISSATVHAEQWSATVKFYPFGRASSFFLGGALGHLDVRVKEGLANGTAEGRVELSTTNLGPVLGWSTGSGPGFFAGLDLGWLFPLARNIDLVVPSGVDPGDLADVRNKLDDYTKYGTPLLRFGFGWYF